MMEPEGRNDLAYTYKPTVAMKQEEDAGFNHRQPEFNVARFEDMYDAREAGYHHSSPLIGQELSNNSLQMESRATKNEYNEPRGQFNFEPTVIIKEEASNTVALAPDPAMEFGETSEEEDLSDNELEEEVLAPSNLRQDNTKDINDTSCDGKENTDTDLNDGALKSEPVSSLQEDEGIDDDDIKEEINNTEIKLEAPFLIKEEDDTEFDPMDPEQFRLQSGNALKKRILKCNNCPFTTVDSAELREHKAASHIVHHQCDLCEYSATKASSLKQHKAFRHEEHKFKCDLCAYTAATAQVIKLHKRTRHEGIRYRIARRFSV